VEVTLHYSSSAVIISESAPPANLAEPSKLHTPALSSSHLLTLSPERELLMASCKNSTTETNPYEKILSDVKCHKYKEHDNTGFAAGLEVF
jgi:hypothetical protein